MSPFTVNQAAERLGIDPSLVRVYCREGRIRAEKLGRDWLISDAALKTFEEHRSELVRPRAMKREEAK